MGDSPIEDLMSEWLELRVYLILNSSSMMMKEVLVMLAKQQALSSRVYPNFNKLCLTLPIATVDCERAFSTMRRIKTHLRSQMINTTLNNCMRISMEGLPFKSSTSMSQSTFSQN